ncbi:sensor histidine kinase [Lysinibacillus sp. NPDC097162]|uniref:sensor histidine kinase n=1 Tax=Lysinibacillus sp. NPDC097162 TaxID=3364140 RepID=UPI00381A8585
MKIKSWLLIMFFIVMIVPIGGAYGLYMWINAYYHDKSFAEYMEKWTELNRVKSVLNDPSLYTKNADLQQVKVLTSDQLAITLYAKSGFVYYSSNPLNSGFVSREVIMKNLFELQQKYNAFTYKEPIYQKGELVGIYEIQLVRKDWVQGVENRSWFVIASIITLFLAIYMTVILLLNRKLNRPLQKLMQQMHAFGKGKHVESAIATRKDEIGELANTFLSMQSEIETARAHLKEEQQQKELMIASISHDLKTPLTSIQAYAESLQNPLLSSQMKEEYRAVILTKAVDMKEMLEDLLMYTLLQSTSYDVSLVQVEGQEFFDMALSEYEPLCQSKGFSLRTLCEVEGAYAVHPSQMQRVIDNLMSNATHFGTSGTTIGLAAISNRKLDWGFDFVNAALTQKKGMYLVVQNSGAGVCEQEINQLFEPLYQSDNARTKTGQRGTGLGLSIAKQIIEKHGGTVNMVSQQGVGTAVLCWLPLYKGADEQ